MDDRKNTCLCCTKRSNSLLSDLSNNELKILDKNRYEISYKSGEIICKEGTKPFGLICLNKGKVKIVRRGINGNNQIVGLKKAVDFIGFRGLMGESSYLSSAVTLEDSTVCVIEKKDFFKVIENNKYLAFKIIKLFANNLIRKDSRLVNLTQKHIRARLAETLLQIHNIYGTNTTNGNLNVSLKRSDLACIANMTTANAIRVLSAFNKEKLVDVSHRHIKINDFKVLKEISISDR
ncbi:MAG: Crp/Fnr family transcriptional regulator [Bacteroidetes bacterium]|nr:MAG: Crp/Fnr family transcriptional regulator [Bacteroidota bacterium]